MTTSHHPLPDRASTAASHFPGGNRFDDMRIDIAESHRRIDTLPRAARSIARSRLHNAAALFIARVTIRLRIRELLVVNGVIRGWLDDFRRYWTHQLGGRTITTLDFFMLLFDYRKRQQQTRTLEWNSPTQHLNNWQDPRQIYATLHHARKLALQPTTPAALWQQIRPGMQILEYGCSLAPFYYSYRAFFSHRRCTWTLADIPNFPFHYAKYLYRNDADTSFVTINDSDFTNPLGDRRDFDVIILTTVLEHLDDPLLIVDYLLARLRPGGLLAFDYIKSDALGLDHPRALADREACLQRILAQTTIVHGQMNDLSQSVDFCIVRKTGPSPA